MQPCCSVFVRIAEDGLSAQEQWYSLFVLLDAEIADASWLKQRLGRLLCYRESAERWPVYQHFPPVLVLVSTPRRMELWQWCAMEAATVLHVAPLSGAIACVPDQPETRAPTIPGDLPGKRSRHMYHANSSTCCIRCPSKQSLLVCGITRSTDTVTSEKMLTPKDDTDYYILTYQRKRSKIIVGNYMDRAKAIPKRSDR